MNTPEFITWFTTKVWKSTRNLNSIEHRRQNRGKLTMKDLFREGPFFKKKMKTLFIESLFCNDSCFFSMQELDRRGSARRNVLTRASFSAGPTSIHRKHRNASFLPKLPSSRFLPTNWTYLKCYSFILFSFYTHSINVYNYT